MEHVGRPSPNLDREAAAAYGSDGDYFSKPSVDDIVETAYDVMREVVHNHLRCDE